MDQEENNGDSTSSRSENVREPRSHSPSGSVASSSTMTLQVNGDLSARSSATNCSFSRKGKISAVRQALMMSNDTFNISRLRQLAISRGGLVSDEFRRVGWPLLAKVSTESRRWSTNSSFFTADEQISPSEELQLMQHRDYQQVLMDVRRTLARFPPKMGDDQRRALQHKLTFVIMRVLCKHKQLYYYQGFHDICLTLLVVVGEEQALLISERLVKTHLRDFLQESMERVQRCLLLIYPLIGSVDPELERFMERSDVGVMFALPWLITWFGHVLGDFRRVVRLYDLFLASHPLMPVYLAAAIVLYRSNEILSAPCDMGSIHCLLATFPDSLPLEHLITDATDLFARHPPSAMIRELDKRKKRSRRWALVRRGAQPFSVTFWTVALSVAGWYVFQKYGHSLPWR